MVILFTIIGIVCVVWIIGWYISNDMSVSTKTISSYKNVLVIYPHPDDETLASGGIIKNFIDQGSKTTLIVLTQGEKGNDDAHLDISLKQIRKYELERASAFLGIKRVILEDFGDGELCKKKTELTMYIKNKLTEIKPDCILTYDLAGLYGHEDHIVTSEIITSLIKKQFPSVTLMYASLPKRTLSLITLPEHMAKDPAYAKRRVTPNMKVYIGGNIYFRIQALYSYTSQLYSFRKSFPVSWIPLWYYYSMQIFEYYHIAH